MKMYLPPRGHQKSRRSFLKRGFFGGLVLAMGGGALLVTRRSATVDIPAGLQILNASEYAVVWSLVQRFVPVRDGFPSPDTLKTALAADAIIAMTEEVTRQELRQLLMLFENALPNFLFGFRTSPFTQLSPTEQEQVLTEWRDSKLTIRRTGYSALRGIIMAAYYGNPMTWSAVGYGGPPKGIHDPNAAVWKGGDAARPLGNGSYHEPAPQPEVTP